MKMRQTKGRMVHKTKLTGSWLTQAMTALVVALTCVLLSNDVRAQAFEGFPDARMRDFERQRACEQNLPTCLPQVRRQMEQRTLIRT